jgi:uncharacterized protein (DUF305 family)
MRIPSSLAVAAVPLALLVAACGGDDDDTAPSQDDQAEQTTGEQTSAEHNEADVEFAQMMIPHHRQAVEMAELAAERAEAPEIADLAERIEAAQAPEIEQMTGWLEDWGEDVPADDAGGHDMGSMADGDVADGTTTSADATEGGHGMMSGEDMATLEAASGAEFDRMFAEMMVEHHQGAVDMANDEIENGQYADAIELAEAIVEAQEAEIAELEGFLDQAR